MTNKIYRAVSLFLTLATAMVFLASCGRRGALEAPPMPENVLKFINFSTTVYSSNTFLIESISSSIIP
jgi:hypothetical protein